mgnify:FL=1
MYKNIFITGPPGSGKSTLLMGIVRELEARNIRVRGIVCPEVRRGRSRWGFRVVVYPDGVEEVLASVDIRSGPRVSKYRVNVNGFEKVGVVALEDSLRNPDVRVILIDEIGKMELFSRRFRDVVVRILDSDKVVLGVLGRVRDPLVSSIRRRRDTLIVELSYGMSDEDRVLVKERILDSILSVVF